MIFDSGKIAEINKQAIIAGLHAPEKRNILFFGVPMEYLADLPALPEPGNQTLSDLQGMSRDLWVGDTIPLAIWLRNAANQTRAFPERTAFFARCAEEAEAAPRPTSTARQNESTLPPPDKPTEPEIDTRRSVLLYAGAGATAAALVLYGYISLLPTYRPNPPPAPSASLEPEWVPLPAGSDYVNNTNGEVVIREEARTDANDIVHIGPRQALFLGGVLPSIERGVVDNQTWLKLTTPKGVGFVLESGLKPLDNTGAMLPGLNK